MIARRRLPFASAAVLSALVLAAGCGKKAAPPPPPPPPAAVAPAPTAELTATPSAIAPGEQVVLAWKTSNATDVQIEGIGAVPSAGTRSVTPSTSTSFHLIARGDGGSTDATARVTVTAPVAAASTDTSSVDEATFKANMQPVFFDYDASELRADAQGVVTQDAAFLKKHDAVKVVIGGYCDERGSSEYNLALGESRANAVKQALIAAGISPDRIRVVSYGKEKQFCSEHSESCWQQNRRGDFELDK